ncbi:disulfide bond formation protein B [Aquibaculum sediminis]|uniref:disulfide bond formation protein B n=1 Tax=Aquibaculum sediminis TaxID=3231907 RepID=UPI0034522E94
MSPYLLRQLNALAGLAIAGLLGFAFLDQIVFGDIPCPLCLLQRVAFLLAGCGFALNAVFGSRPTHYGLTLLGAVAGASLSARQMLLHIVPGSGSYGEPLFGLHFYTWAFIAFAAIIVGCAVLLLFEARGARSESGPTWRSTPLLGKLAVGLLLLMALGNAGSTFAECELGLCPDDPLGYELFETD